jgi:hypothetical protein
MGLPLTALPRLSYGIAQSFKNKAPLLKKPTCFELVGFFTLHAYLIISDTR